MSALVEGRVAGRAAAHAGVDARRWLIWLVAVATVTMVARNPLYTLLILLVIQVVETTSTPGVARRPLSLARLAPFILGFSVLFNLLFVHIGQTVLFRLPAEVPLLGGPITFEAFVYGLQNGLLLLALLALFTAFNRIVPTGELVRLAPRAFRDLGVVVLIAITYVPETARHLQRIREAQAIRGHRLRGVRDWQPVVIPLLVGGMERAMNVAESMVARGYGAPHAQPQRGGLLAALVGGLLLFFAGWLLALWLGWPGLLLLTLSTLWLVAVIWRAGRSVTHTRYRPHKWGWDDTLVAAGTLAACLLIALRAHFAAGVLGYTPYPLFQLPSFDPVVGLGLFLLAAPALLPLASRQ